MVKRVRGIVFSTSLTIGLLALAVIAARKTNIGEQIINGLRGFGQATGQALTSPFTGIVEGVTQGGRDLFSAGGTAGADIQQAFTGNRDAIGDFFAGLANPVPEARGDTGGLQLDVSQSTKTLQKNIELGLSRFGVGTQSFALPTVTQDLIDIGVTGEPSTTGQFGGFGSAQAQEEALRRLIEENKKKFSQFFS